MADWHLGDGVKADAEGGDMARREAVRAALPGEDDFGEGADTGHTVLAADIFPAKARTGGA